MRLDDEDEYIGSFSGRSYDPGDSIARGCLGVVIAAIVLIVLCGAIIPAGIYFVGETVEKIGEYQEAK